MTILLFLVMLAANVVMSLLNRRSKFLYWASFLFLLILCAGNAQNADYINYSRSFNYVVKYGWNPSIEPGYSLLMYLFLQLSHIYPVGYQGFVICISIVCFAILKKSIDTHTDNPHAVIFLYAIYPAINNFIGLRYFLAYVLFLYSLKYLQKGTAFGNCIFTLLTVAAASIHVSLLLLIPFVLFQMLSIEKAQRTILIAVPIMVLLAYTPLISTLANFFGLPQIARYFTGYVGIGFLLMFGVYTLYYTVYLCSRRIILQNKTDIQQRLFGSWQERFCILVEKLNLYLFFSFPLIMINGVFIRIWQPVILCNYIVLSIAISQLSFIKRSLLLAFAAAISLFLYFFALHGASEDVFQHNMLFSL